MPVVDFRGMLRALADSGEEFIVVGTVSAVLQGAPIGTFDLDVVVRDSSIENLRHSLSRDGLDLHTSSGYSRSFDHLVLRSELMEIGDGLCIRVLDLGELIKIKEERATDVDRAALFVLRHTLEEKRKLTSKTTPSPSDPSSRT